MLGSLLLTMGVVTIAVLVAEAVMPGVRVRRMGTALLVALVFGLLNLFVRWIVTGVLAILLLPAAVLTLGLAYLVLGLLVNAVLLYFTDKLMAGFELRGLGSLLGTAALISVSGWLVHLLV
jgi:putative membrane protein